MENGIPSWFQNIEGAGGYRASNDTDEERKKLAFTPATQPAINLSAEGNPDSIKLTNTIFG